MPDRSEHWQSVYLTKRPDEVSWFRSHLDTSLRLIEQNPLGPRAAVIDVGGGASTLVDDLLDRGYEDVTVLDVSSKALDVARERLGERAARVRWIAADATQVELDAERYDVWHDRAVFHFLTDPRDRAEYVRRLARAVRTDGTVVMSTFGPGGPLRCSGLEVVRYDADSLVRELGEPFELVDHLTETHVTPAGKEQRFLSCAFRKRAPSAPR